MRKFVLIASIVVIVISVSVVSGLMLAQEKPNHVLDKETLVSENIQQPQSIENINKLSCNCVAFRLDDVPGPFPIVEIELINFFMEKKIALTLGIMGGMLGDVLENDVLSENNKAISIELIKEELKKNAEILELSNHSWRHRNLLAFDREGQLNQIMKTDHQIIEIFGKKPAVFLPPYNNFNQDTIEILKENGYTHMSSGRNKDFAPFPLKDSEFYRFPATTLTGWRDTSGEWVTSPHQVTFSEIKKGLSDHGFAVVMMHPRDYTMKNNTENFDVVNEKQIQELELLIKDIQDNGLRIVLLGKINIDS